MADACVCVIPDAAYGGYARAGQPRALPLRGVMATVLEPTPGDPHGRAMVERLVAEGASLAAIDAACGDVPDLRRLGRHLWARRQVTSGVRPAALAETLTVGRRTVKTWLTPLDDCACGAIKRVDAPRCQACKGRWVRDANALVTAREEFRRQYGRDPRPTDWRSDQNAKVPGVWPSRRTVLRHFDDWSSFLAA